MTATGSSATKAAVTRRRNKALASGGTYGALLQDLWAAQKASDRAKSRAANGKHRRDFGSYAHADHNYRGSREARERDYEEKEEHLAKACKLLASEDLSLAWGWQLEPDRHEDLECWGCYGSGKQSRTCRSCGGKGAEQCSDCNGSGEIVCMPCAGEGEEGQKCICNGSIFVACPACDGTGIDGGKKCPGCSGEDYLCDDECRCKGLGAVGEVVRCYHCQGKGTTGTYMCDRCGGTGVYDQRVIPGMAILYVDLPSGQVSFHSPTRGDGPDYDGAWDEIKDASRERIIAAIDRLVEHPDELRANGTAA